MTFTKNKFECMNLLDLYGVTAKGLFILSVICAAYMLGFVAGMTYACEVHGRDGAYAAVHAVIDASDLIP